MFQLQTFWLESKFNKTQFYVCILVILPAASAATVIISHWKMPQGGTFLLQLWKFIAISSSWLFWTLRKPTGLLYCDIFNSLVKQGLRVERSNATHLVQKKPWPHSHITIILGLINHTVHGLYASALNLIVSASFFTSHKQVKKPGREKLSATSKSKILAF